MIQKKYLICFRELFNSEKEIGTYVCEADNMKQAVEFLKEISNHTLEILSISELDASITSWKDLEK